MSISTAFPLRARVSQCKGGFVRTHLVPLRACAKWPALLALSGIGIQSDGLADEQHKPQ
jgi:hypothetical protein